MSGAVWVAAGVNEDLSVVFYDLTTIRAEGLSQQDGDVRYFGMSKEGVIARQFMLGVVQTADGMPLFHEVFDGNAAEAPTLEPTLKKVLARYPHIRRLVVVADRGLLSLDNTCWRRPKSDPLVRDLIAVGMPVTRHPPHRSVRARFGHTAPTLGI